MNTRRLAALLLSLVPGLHAADAPAWLAAPPVARIATVGQSYNTKDDILAARLKDIGLAPANAGFWAVAGADVTWYKQEVEKLSNAPSPKLRKGEYDVFVLTPNLRQWSPGSAQSKNEATKFYTDIVRAANPRALILVNTLWPRADQVGEERKTWLTTNRELVLAAMAVADAARPENSTPIRLSPRGEAIELVYDLATAGQVPGLEDALQLYGDGGHAGECAQYINAFVEASLIAQRPALAFPDPKNLPADQARIFRLAAWRALTTQPNTGFARPADTTPPTPVAAAKTDSLASDRAVLSWRDATDPESAVFSYEIERGDGAKFTTLLPRLIDATVKEGVAYTYRIRARNFADQLSTPVELAVTPPADTTPPALTRAVAANPSQIQLFFSEPLDGASATDLANYTLAGGLTLKSARLADSSGRLVVLETAAPLPDGKPVALGLRNLRDRAAKPNAIAAASTPVRYDRPKWETIDRDDWDGTVVNLQGDNLLITAKGGYLRAAIFKHPRIVGVHRTIEGDFSFTVALTSQEKGPGAMTGILFSPTVDALTKDEVGLLGVTPGMQFQLDVPVTMESGIEKSRSIVVKGPKGKFLDFPCWLRLVRKGNHFAAYQRLKGAPLDQWTLVGEFTATREVPTTMVVGVFHHGSTKDDAANTAMFDLSGRDDAASFTDRRTK